MEKVSWPDLEQKEEDDDATFMDEDLIIAPSEAKVEQMLSTKLTLDAVDMGTLPNADYKAWAKSNLRRTTSEYSLEERRSSNLSLRGLNRDDASASPKGMVARIPSLQRIRTSASMERLDEAGSVSSPRSDMQRRSSNLSQVLSTLKKSPSMEFYKTVSRDEHTSSPAPPPPFSEAAVHTLGPRRQSNLAVMRLIAESM